MIKFSARALNVATPAKPKHPVAQAPGQAKMSVGGLDQFRWRFPCAKPTPT